MHAITWAIRGALLCALATSAGPSAGAQDIYKCVEDGATAYQSAPCANGQIEMRMTTGATQPKSEFQMAAASPPAQSTSHSSGPWRRTSLALGMSDDEVLNLPGWGRPNRITRTRVSRVWHEEWTYGQRASDERSLHFANARLVDIIDKPPLDQVARLTLQ
jgi:hypothetical protein